MSEPSWHLLESDPGVFSELLEALGVKNIDVEELWNLDDLIIKNEENTCGVVFLFKWQGQRSRSTTAQLPTSSEKVVFIKQVVENACGTIALLHVLLNREGVEIGETLEGLKGFIADMDGETAGSCLASHEGVRMAHNSFVRPEAFSIEDDSRASKSEDAFHFVAYVPKNGIVYELDGLSKGPSIVGESGCNWLNTAQVALQRRISEYSQLEIRFNLLVVQKSTLYTSMREAAAILVESECLLGALLSVTSEDGINPQNLTFPSSDEVAAMFGERVLPDPSVNAESLAEASIARLLASCSPELASDALKTKMRGLQARLMQCGETVAQEKERIAKYRRENERRRHQFVPLIMELLRGLADRGKLPELYEKGKKRAVDEKERKRIQKLNAKAERDAEAKASSSSSSI